MNQTGHLNEPGNPHLPLPSYRVNLSKKTQNLKIGKEKSHLGHRYTKLATGDCAKDQLWKKQKCWNAGDTYTAWMNGGSNKHPRRMQMK